VAPLLFFPMAGQSSQEKEEKKGGRKEERAGGHLNTDRRKKEESRSCTLQSSTLAAGVEKKRGKESQAGVGVDGFQRKRTNRGGPFLILSSGSVVQRKEEKTMAWSRVIRLPTQSLHVLREKGKRKAVRLSQSGECSSVRNSAAAEGNSPSSPSVKSENSSFFTSHITRRKKKKGGFS